MKFFYHLGAHCTDEDRLLRCLLKNQGVLAKSGTMVSGPGRYRPVLRQALSNLKGKSAPPAMQEAIMDAVIDQDNASRIFFASDSFICVPRYVVGRARLYPMMAEKLSRLHALFPIQDIGFSLGLRNPATLIPRIYAKMEQNIPFEQMIEGIDLTALRWSDTIKMMQEAEPDAEIVVWANEDAPLIWPEVMSTVSAYTGETPLEGFNDFLSTLMRPEGLQRMATYMQSHTPKTALQRQKIVGAFLDKFAKEATLEEEIDLPGWTEEVIWTLTRAYEEDLERIAQLPGITFIRP